jgi:hypothetical protein
MVQLDHQLLFNARRMINPFTGDHLEEMIVAYEQAVDHHNRDYTMDRIYRIQSEVRLRSYVRAYQDAELRDRTIVAIDHAMNGKALFDKNR